MHFISQFVREFLIAIQFFTRIPITGRLAEWVGYSPELLRASAGHFPGVGVVVGTVAALVFALLIAQLPQNTLSPLIAAALSTVVTVLLTGGFHEDGMADVADGLGGSYNRERALDIMKDSRVGAFGAMALVLVLLVKIALLALLGSIPPEFESADAEDFSFNFDGWLACAALWTGHVVSRTLPLVLIALLPHVGDTERSKSKPLADQIKPSALWVAAFWCFSAIAVASLVLPAINLIVACSFSMVALLWMRRMFNRRLQGFTGDCLGATQQVCEIAFYLGLAIIL